MRSVTKLNRLRRVLAVGVTGLVGGAAGAAAPGQATAAPVSAAPVSAAAAATVTRTLTTGMAVPWGMVFVNTNAALIGDRDSANVYRLGDGVRRFVGKVPGVVSNGSSGGEGGLLGMAVSPTFGTDHWVYFYTTTASDNRVVKMQYTKGYLRGGTQVVLKGIPKGLHHNGGGLVFSKWGSLYISTGEGGVPDRAQDRGSLGGKILRIRGDGSIPYTNPWTGSPVWSIGHRNVEGLAFDSSWRLWSTEFGQNAWDELNLILKAHNYGWPATEGTTSNPAYTSPKRQWSTSTAGPTHIVIRSNVAWITGLTGQRLWRVPLNGTSTGTPTSSFTGTYGRLRALGVSTDGSLWVGTSNRDGRATPRSGNDRILRVAVS